MRFALILAMVFWPMSSYARSSEEIVAILEAAPWGWPDGDPFCQDKTRTFTFNSDRTLMNSYVSEEDINVVYKVHSFGNTSVTMEIIGEHQQIWDGAIVVWELRLVETDAFCWHNTAMRLLSCSPFLRRCDKQYHGS